MSTYPLEHFFDDKEMAIVAIKASVDLTKFSQRLQDDEDLNFLLAKQVGRLGQVLPRLAKDHEFVKRVLNEAQRPVFSHIGSLSDRGSALLKDRAIVHAGLNNLIRGKEKRSTGWQGLVPSDHLIEHFANDPTILILWIGASMGTDRYKPIIVVKAVLNAIGVVGRGFKIPSNCMYPIHLQRIDMAPKQDEDERKKQEDMLEELSDAAAITTKAFPPRDMQADV